MKDLKLFDTEKGLDFVDNDASLFKMLLEGFLNDTPFSKEHLFEMIEKNDFDNADHYVHRIKGAAGQLGADPLRFAGQELEDVLRKKKDGDAKNLAKEFADIYEKTFLQMSEVFKSL